MARKPWLAAAIVAVVASFVPVHASAQVFELAELSEMPTLKSPQAAQRTIAQSYPRNLQQAGIGGTVQMRFVVGTDGKVQANTIEVIATSSTALGEAASEAIANIEFVPGKKDGSSVASRVVMPIRYAAS